MASINGVSSSSYSSIYGNRNIISGLASGLDTESMIENSVAGYKAKIESLIKDQTKLSWKQDAYRSITDKLIALQEMYTSYSSKTNLSSNSFFTQSVNTTTNGKYADLISATGKTNSDIQINSVKQLATAARYSVSAKDGLGWNIDNTVSGKIDWDAKHSVSKVAGDMTLTYGSMKVDLSFGEGETYDSVEKFAQAIRNKLGEQNITIGNTTYKASDRIKVEVTADGNITFEDNSTAGNSVYVSSVSGGLKDFATEGTGDDKGKFALDKLKGASLVDNDVSTAKYLSGKTLSVTVDGTTKNIKIGELGSTDTMDQLVNNLNSSLQRAFGNKKLQVSKTADGGLAFDPANGSTFKITSGDEKVNEALGFGKNKSGLSNYLDKSKTLKDLVGDSLKNLDKKAVMQGSGTITQKKDEDGNAIKDSAGNDIYLDASGNRVVGGKGSNKYNRLDDDGKEIMGYELTMNGKSVGVFDENTTLESVFTAINNSDVGVTVNYSDLTGKITFTSKETGADSEISFGDGLAETLFVGNNYFTATDGFMKGALTDKNGTVIGAKDDNGTYCIYYKEGKFVKDYVGASASDKDGTELTDDEKAKYLPLAIKGHTAGQDAEVNITVNGENMTLKRPGNNINMDGLSVTLKGTFNETLKVDDNGKMIGSTPELADGTKLSTDASVTFTTKADSDKIVDTLKAFVEEYNTVMKEVHDAFSTQPAKKNGSRYERYEPLSDEDKEGMSEDAIKEYEEKAKQGILFGDSDLSSLYNQMRSTITPGGDARKLLESIGITTTYDNGVTSLSLDENKLRDALENNPDNVRRAFTSSKENGDSTDGLMARMKKMTNMYASTSIGNYGILVRKAGTKTKSLTLMNNAVQKQIDNLDKKIDSWQAKMSDKIDYYTRQFTALEQLMSQMNNQSSMLAGMMGGG